MLTNYELLWACVIIIEGLWKVLINNIAKFLT
jgi:hypothetical protein